MQSLRRKLLRVQVLIPLVAVLTAVLWYWHPWQRQIPIVIRERINPRDGSAMVWVPAGKFCMGSSKIKDLKIAILHRNLRVVHDVLQGIGDVQSGEAIRHYANETPPHDVDLNGYWIYKYEVTVAQYRAFCRATKHAMPPRLYLDWQNNLPIVNVTWNDAQAYAGWAGAMLPTEAEWEKAARGADGRLYPWGNAWDGTKCSNSVGTPATVQSPVGSFPLGASQYGAQDMAGSVLEWCADWYAPNYYGASPAKNPAGPATGKERVLRGGSWCCSLPDNFRIAFRDPFDPTGLSADIGFRCVVRSPGP